MLAIGNEELKGELKSHIDCSNCGNSHPIEYGDEIMKDGTKRQTKILAFYKCGDSTYLAGINGRSI